MVKLIKTTHCGIFTTYKFARCLGRLSDEEVYKKNNYVRGYQDDITDISIFKGKNGMAYYTYSRITQGNRANLYNMKKEAQSIYIQSKNIW